MGTGVEHGHHDFSNLSDGFGSDEQFIKEVRVVGFYGMFYDLFHYFYDVFVGSSFLGEFEIEFLLEFHGCFEVNNVLFGGSSTI